MKFRTIDENSNRYRRLNRALFGDYSNKIKTFAIISPENPLGWKNATKQEFIDKFLRWTNNKRLYNKDVIKELKTTDLLHKIEETGDRALKYGGFTYIPIKGRYGDIENSFLILNLTLSDAKTIAGNYGQESFFFAKVDKDGTTIGYYMTNDPNCKSYKLIELSNVITDETEAEDFYSKFGSKFRINMKEFGDTVPEVINQQAFEESFDELNRDFASRAVQRRQAYRNN